MILATAALFVIALATIATTFIKIALRPSPAAGEYRGSGNAFPPALRPLDLRPGRPGPREYAQK